MHYRHSTALRPPTILAYEKRPNRRDNPARCEDGRPLEPYHSGCPSALKCGILCFSAKKKTQVAPRSSCYRQSPTFVRTKSRRACAEAALRAAAILVRPGEATVILAYRSGRLSVARDRFEVLGVRGDINKSTTFGTEDKCNPLEVTIGAALRYQTLRSHTATEIGAGKSLCDRTFFFSVRSSC